MDFKAFKIVGFDQIYPFEYITDDDRYTPKHRKPNDFDHWLYGPCNNQSDTEGIADLITFSQFEKSACIRKYYNKKTNKLKKLYYLKFPKISNILIKFNDLLIISNSILKTLILLIPSIIFKQRILLLKHLIQNLFFN